MKKTVVLITGASSGIGKATAERLFEKGFTVYGTSRSESFSVNKTSSAGGSFTSLILDVTDEGSITSCVDEVITREGRIDVLINNAGFGIAGSIEDTSVDEMHAQLNTNLYGTHRMCRAVLPHMRKERSGKIINISSIAGFISIPFQGFYSVSKYGIEAYSRALHCEVKDFGITVSIVQPGDTKTGFTGMRRIAKETNSGAYRDVVAQSIKRMENDEQNGCAPDMLAKVVEKIIISKNPKLSTAVGIQYKLVKLLNKFFPERFVYFIIKKLYG